MVLFRHLLSEIFGRFDCTWVDIFKTPIWYPDGEYTVKYAVYDLWTPAGMLTGNTYALIRINGSMYDDYYTNRN